MELVTKSFERQHEAIVSRLEYWQIKDGKMHYYPRDAFSASIRTFDNLPIIYANSHPPRGVKGNDLNDVLKEIGGTLAGYTSNSMTNDQGSEYLKTTFNIIDKNIDKKIVKGDMFLSLGFRCRAPDVGYLDGVNGDHVLIYDRSSGIPQGDPGALILNQDVSKQNEVVYMECELVLGDSMAEQDYTKGIGEIVSLLKLNMGEFNEKFLVQESEKLKLSRELEDVKEINLKLNTALAEKDSIIAELNGKLSSVEAASASEKANRIKTNQDNFWNSLPNSIQDKFKERKSDMEDPELMFKLNQDINAALRLMPKVEIDSAEGDPEIVPELKVNQNSDLKNDVDWDKYNVRF